MKQTRDVIINLIFLGAIITTVNGHGALTLPSSKNGGTLSTPHLTAAEHLNLTSFGMIDKAFFDGDHFKTPWSQPGEFDFNLARDLIPNHPETFHPCGCNAGDIAQCAGVGVATGFGETISGASINPPEWSKGSVEEVGWNAWINHGGGDIFMLCKKTDFDHCRDTLLPTNLIEATKTQSDAYLLCVWNCFESQVLEFDDESHQKLQYKDDVCTYVAIDTLDKVGKNNIPFRFTPIPDHLQIISGREGECTWDSVLHFSNDKAESEFTNSFGDKSICDSGRDNHSPKDWHVIDRVKVPTHIEQGEYLLSWRWDAYTIDQLWTNCADISIVNTYSSTPSPQNCSPTPTLAHNTTSPPPTPAPIISTTPPPILGLNCPPGLTGFLPYDYCSKFFRCVNGIFYEGSLLNCTSGSLFDMNLQYCNWESQVRCEDN